MLTEPWDIGKAQAALHTGQRKQLQPNSREERHLSLSLIALNQWQGGDPVPGMPVQSQPRALRLQRPGTGAFP